MPRWSAQHDSPRMSRTPRWLPQHDARPMPQTPRWPTKHDARRMHQTTALPPTMQTPPKPDALATQLMRTT